jgi:hypothetical protein
MATPTNETGYALQMQLASHAKQLEAEFNFITKGAEMVAHEIADTANPVLEDRVFQIASKVALHFAAMHRSNFYT